MQKTKQDRSPYPIFWGQSYKIFYTLGRIYKRVLKKKKKNFALCGGELHLLKMKTYLLEVLNRVLTKLCLSMPKKGKNLQVSFLLEKKDNKCTQMHLVKHHLIA